MFYHKSQKQFYIDYAIKEQMSPTEYSINLFGVRLKKEVTDIWNRLQILNGYLPLEWVQVENYEQNEIVSYNDKNYMCLAENINKIPNQEPSFWKEINASDISNVPYSNYLSKDNQEYYDPSNLLPHETSIDYHPTTVKYVLDQLRHWFANEIVENARKLDGHEIDYFLARSDFMQYVQTAVHKQDIIDNLESDATKKPLSARQGQILKSYIDKINEILTSNDISLDELQEIVNWIKTNRQLIESLNIDSILGLRDYLNKLDLEDSEKVSFDYWHNEFLNKLKSVDGAGSGVDADLLDGYHADYFLPAQKFNPLEISKLLQSVPGSIGRIDADLLDGYHATDFLRRSSSDTPAQDNLYNLGSPAKRWSNIYAVNFQGTALKAKYADLAEKYEYKYFNDDVDVSDYVAGDVLGIDENGISYFKKGMKLIGVISACPGFVLNDDAAGISVALKGKVDVKIEGSARPGDYIYAFDNGKAIASHDEIKSKHLILIGVCIAGGNDIVEVKV